MVSLLGFLCVVATMNMVTIASSKEFKVGENGDWRQPDVANNTEMYNQWASQKRFLVGDSIYFEYKNDSVLVVDKGGYYHCNTTNPISAFNDGKTVIKLEKPGPTYFVSGAPDHCKNGQRLIINVMTLHPTPQSPPSIANPPQSFLTHSPSPSPNPSSGISITVTITALPVLLTLITTTTFITLFWCAP